MKISDYTNSIYAKQTHVDPPSIIIPNPLACFVGGGL